LSYPILAKALSASEEGPPRHHISVTRRIEERQAARPNVPYGHRARQSILGRPRFQRGGSLLNAANAVPLRRCGRTRRARSPEVDAVIFAVNPRPVIVSRGFHRTAMVHGVSVLCRGERFFHAAA